MSNKYVVTTPAGLSEVVVACQEHGELVPYSVEHLQPFLESHELTELHVKCDETITQLGQARDLARDQGQKMADERDAARLRNQEPVRTLSRALGLMHGILIDADDESVREDERVAKLIELGMPGFTKHIEISVRLSGDLTIEFPEAAYSVDEEKVKRAIREALEDFTVGHLIEERLFRDRHDAYSQDDLGDIEIDGSINIDRIS